MKKSPPWPPDLPPEVLAPRWMLANRKFNDGWENTEGARFSGEDKKRAYRRHYDRMISGSRRRR